MSRAQLFCFLSCILGVQSISNSLKIKCGKERQEDEWHPRLAYTLEELRPSHLPRMSIALPYISTAKRMTTCVAPDPCINGGSRVLEGDVYRCSCSGNHVGQYCQSCRVGGKTYPKGELLFYAFAPLNGKTTLSFKMRGSTGYISIQLENKHVAIFGLCFGWPGSRYAAITLMEGDDVKERKNSGPFHVECDPSRFDSYWIEKTDRHAELGIAGNSTPVLKMQWDRKEAPISIGLGLNPGTEWIVDHPCID